MHIYDDMFSKYSITVAHSENSVDKNQSFRIRNVASMYKIPLNGCCNWVSFRFSNENDTVAIDELELEIGENDSLSAVIATVADADLLVVLSVRY